MSTPATLGYSTDKQLFAARYKQGGRTAYSLALSPGEIAALVKRPNPEARNPGNRKIRPAHAAKFARYFIEQEQWVSPGIILRAPNIFKFEANTEVPDMQFGTLTFPVRSEGDIQILDGQHRILGFHIALEQVDALAEKARQHLQKARSVQDVNAEKEARAEIKRLDKVRDRLYKERVTVEIQVTDDLTAFRQIFFDIADNALGITASVKARFDSRKVVNRALPIVFDHPLLQGRVDEEVDRISMKNLNWMSAKHVMEIVRVLTVGYNGRVSRRQDKELSHVEIAKTANDFFDFLEEVFPPLKAMEIGQVLPKTLRETSMLGSPAFVKILAGLYYAITIERAVPAEQVKKFFTDLGQHIAAPAHENSIWQTQAKPEAFTLDAWSPNGRRQDLQGLVDSLTEWALAMPSFISDPPKAAPVEPAPDPDEGLDFAFNLDVKPLEVEERNALEDIAKEGAKKARAVKKPAPRKKAGGAKE